MKLWRMEIRHPQSRDLVLLAIVIALIAGIGAGLSSAELIREEIVWPTTVALSTGAVMSGFGISIAKYGFRALICVVVAGMFLVWLAR